jgi:glycosyltransferase involved in cell wall biosynthesis
VAFRLSLGHRDVIPLTIMRFSIVLPTLNRREMLLCAIASVRAQNWPDVEMIVVDGGSTDGTIEQLSTMADLRLLKGPDRGIYDAFNKGIASATGDLVGILNSDDAYETGSFVAVAQAFAQVPAAHAVCGAAVLVEAEHVLATFDSEPDQRLISPRTCLIGSCVPNARFFRRAAMAAIGPFSLEFRYVSDRDWLTRWYEAGFTTTAVRQPVYRYRQHPGSLTFDPHGPHVAAIRADLLALAQKWRTNSAASPETRRVAALLEGRCRTMLGLDAVQRGQIREAARLLLSIGGHPSLAPLALSVRACVDRIIAGA